jgi:hypothetical protein
LIYAFYVVANRRAVVNADLGRLTGGKMKTYRILAMVFLLLASSATFAKPSRATTAAANRSWQSFWLQITSAINKKDRVALRKMMPDNFFDGGGGLTPNQWLKFIDENERKGSWRDLQKSFAQGTVINRNWPDKGIPTRVTKDNGYYFEFRKDKKWYFAGVVGD